MNNEQLQRLDQEAKDREEMNLLLDLRELERDLTAHALQRMKLEKRKAKLVLKALEQDMSLHQVAKEIGVTADSLVRIARDNGYEYDTLARMWIKRPVNVRGDAGE